LKNVQILPKNHMHIFKVFITTVQMSAYRRWLHKEGTIYSKHAVLKVNYIIIHFLKNVETLPKTHMHIFKESVTTVQSLENVSFKVSEELITQSKYIPHMKTPRAFITINQMHFVQPSQKQNNCKFLNKIKST
jgi:hypothetical protein